MYIPEKDPGASGALVHDPRMSGIDGGSGGAGIFSNHIEHVHSWKYGEPQSTVSQNENGTSSRPWRVIRFCIECLFYEDVVLKEKI